MIEIVICLMTLAIIFALWALSSDIVKALKEIRDELKKQNQIRIK